MISVFKLHMYHDILLDKLISGILKVIGKSSMDSTHYVSNQITAFMISEGGGGGVGWGMDARALY